MITASTHGAPNWVDLNTPDVEDAEVFYTDLFGWTTQSSDTPMGTYTTASVGSQPVGGMMAASEDTAGMPAMWTVFFHVDDIETTVRAVEDAGGEVLEAPFEIPDGTRIAVVSDPSGAMFACSDGLAEVDGAWYSHQPGGAVWVELLTTDPSTAESFYATVLGWKAATTAAADGVEYTRFLLDGNEVAGMMAMPAEVPAGAPSHWAVYFATDDCEQLVERAESLGATTLMPPMGIDGARFAVLQDRQGAVFDVLEHRP